MRIGIDVSQMAYPNTGVANYLLGLVRKLIEIDDENEYILFFSSLRRELDVSLFNIGDKKNVKVRRFRIPPALLDILWNRWHILPIEKFIGDVDFFITSDWTEPPREKAKKGTIIYDLIVYKHPEETDQKIVSTQKRKLKWVKKESDILLSISESTKNDVSEILKIEKERIKVIYPGMG